MCSSIPQFFLVLCFACVLGWFCECVVAHNIFANDHTAFIISFYSHLHSGWSAVVCICVVFINNRARRRCLRSSYSTSSLPLSRLCCLTVRCAVRTRNIILIHMDRDRDRRGECATRHNDLRRSRLTLANIHTRQIARAQSTTDDTHTPCV